MEYGLIGKTLGHSFSKIVHEAITDYGYELYPLPTEEIFHQFMKERNFKGINVTIPYKQDVIPYCHELDHKAKAIGAVNTIVNKQGKLYGYNTDFDGFLFQIKKYGIDFEGKVLLILGTGGTFKTVHAVGQDQGAKEILIASRTAREGILSYEDLQDPRIQEKVEIIVNTSPVGMYPQVQGKPLSLSAFPHLTGVVDVVYNPQCSLLVQEAKERGLACCGGLTMLIAQAKYAAEHFTGESVPETATDKVFGQIARRQSNLVLIGMPSCGKSTLGRWCAKAMGRDFVDLDEALVEKAGKTIPEIFQEEGEEAFRQLETELCWEYGKESGLVLSTGGGVVTREENMKALSLNGVFAYVKRPLDQLELGKNRPLSQSKEAISTLYGQRSPLYEQYAQITLDNSDHVNVVGKQIQEAYYEIFNSQRS